MANKTKKIPAQQGSPVGYGKPPAEHRFKPGESGNPAGRPSAGASIRDWINLLGHEDRTEADLRKIARDKKAPWTKRAAAERIIRTLEIGDLADFEPYLTGGEPLSALRERGVNTEVVKKAKTKTRTIVDADGQPTTEVEREIELHDRAGDDFDRVMDRTHGKPHQELDVTSGGETLKLLPIRLDGDKEL